MLNIISFKDMGKQVGGTYLSEFTLSNGEIIRNEISEAVLLKYQNPLNGGIAGIREDSDKLALFKAGITQEAFSLFLKEEWEAGRMGR